MTKKTKKDVPAKPRVTVLAHEHLSRVTGGDGPGSGKIKETVVAD